VAKVLYLITKSNWGGAQRYVYDLATHLPEGFEPVVAVGLPLIEESLQGLFAWRLRQKSIRIIALPEAQRDISFVKELRLLIRLFKIVWEERPDILHVNSSKLGGLGAFVGWVTWTRTVFTAHGWPFNEDRPWYWRKFSYFFSWLTSMFATITVTITQKDFTQGKKMWLVGHKMQLVYSAIEQIDFYSRDEARKTLSWWGHKFMQGRAKTPSQILWVGVIAELTPNKGLKYLAEVAEHINGVEFIVVGDGELSEDLGPTKLKLVGFATEANRYLKAFDIFVLPSLKEGLPYTLLEAGQAGLPVVASNIGGIPDIIGQAGMLVPPKNSELLARSLSALIKDERLRQTLGQQLQSRVAKEFNFENFLSQTYALYA